MTGDWLLAVGLAYSVYALTGSTLASAAALLSSFVPQVLVGSVAGVFVDRWDRKRTMVVTNLLLAVGLTPLLLVSGADWIWLVYVVLAVQSCVEVFFAPAEQAFLPNVVEDADLVAANGLNAQIRNLARLFGSGLGGVIAAAGGIRAIAVADAITFVLAALLVARIRTTGRAVVTSAEKASGDPEEATEVVRGRVAALADEWRDGLRTVTSNRVLDDLDDDAADHQHRRGDHGDAVRAVRPARPARQRPGVRRDHRRPGHRRGGRGLPGGRRRRALVAGDDGVGRLDRVRADRPRDLPLPAAVGEPVARRRRHDPGRPPGCRWWSPA